jgi:hypothetical protein
MAPRARFELAIRRGELTAAQEANPFASLAGLELSFPAHGGRAGWKHLGVKQAPGTGVTLRVKCQPGIGVVVLGEAPIQIGGLADVSLAIGVQHDVDEERHFNLAPRARFELATLRLTAECSTIELPGSGRRAGEARRPTFPV